MIYQWVKFMKDAPFPSTDFDLSKWHLVEVDERNSSVSLFGVEYVIDKKLIWQFGNIVKYPNYN